MEPILQNDAMKRMNTVCVISEVADNNCNEIIEERLVDSKVKDVYKKMSKRKLGDKESKVEKKSKRV